MRVCPIQSTLGPSIQLYFKPLVKLKKVSEFDLDDSKQRPLVFEAGYRYITAPNEPVDNRFMPVVTFNFPTKGAILITDETARISIGKEEPSNGDIAISSP